MVFVFPTQEAGVAVAVSEQWCGGGAVLGSRDIFLGDEVLKIFSCPFRQPLLLIWTSSTGESVFLHMTEDSGVTVQ